MYIYNSLSHPFFPPSSSPMEHLKLMILFTFLLSHTIHAQNQNPCHPQYCGSNPLPIRFPFMLQSQSQIQIQSQLPKNCGYPDFLFTCSSNESRGVPVLTLPHSGNFSVRYVNYLMQEIQLYDPDGCLPRRLMILNLTSSPFAAASINTFIFLSCPRDAAAARGFATVDCLGNSTSAVVATTSASLARAMTNMCSTMFTLPIPVSWPKGEGGDDDWLSSDLGGDLRLTWSFPDCQGCEAQGGVCGYDRNSTGNEIMCYFDHGKGKRGLEIFKIIALSIVIPAIICSICISCFTCIVERRIARARAATAAEPLSPPPPPTTGLDESTIESYTKVVLGESKRLPGPNGVTCPICLVDYFPKDTLRCIPECQHCFHSDCVDEWLRLNSSCPVCRNSPSHPLETV